MKTISKFFVLALAAVGLTACFDSDYQATPRIYAVDAFCTHVDGKRDTVPFNTESSVVVMLGDSVRVPLFVDGVYHTLTTFNVSGDTSALAYSLSCDSADMRMLMPDSKPEAGYLHFTETCSGMAVTLYYVAKVKGDFPLTFDLHSTASESYSHCSLQVIQSVR